MQITIYDSCPIQNSILGVIMKVHWDKIKQVIHTHYLSPKSFYIGIWDWDTRTGKELDLNPWDCIFLK